MGKQGEGGEFRAPGGAKGIGLRSVMRHWLGPFTLPGAARQVRKTLETLEVDLVHSLRIPFEGMLGAFAEPKMPLVASVWGNDFTLHARSSPGMTYHTRQALSRVDALLADCTRDIRLAADWGFRPDRPTIVLPGGGGVVRRLFKPAFPEMESLRPEVRKQLEDLPKDSPIVVNPRGFRAYVRNDTFFRSIPGVVERVPGTMFLCPAMAGEAEADRWLDQLKIEQSVRLLPKLSQEEIAMVYRMSTVMVSPSEHDGTPNTFLEAIACGCFPVVGDLASLREWVIDGDNGFLVDPDDPEALAQATSRALMNAELREQARKTNQDLIDERADRDRVAISAERFYKDVVERVKTDCVNAEGSSNRKNEER
jgi:glycosyltransferase involved in cell wall biosynthesis